MVERRLGAIAAARQYGKYDRKTKHLSIFGCNNLSLVLCKYISRHVSHYNHTELDLLTLIYHKKPNSPVGKGPLQDTPYTILNSDPCCVYDLPETLS